MKKFYYKKAESLDRTPIILRLQRRHTIDAKQDANEERPISERAASICSLDQLTTVPAIPRARSRDIAKSFSEDSNLDKSKLRVPKRVITEAELSSSGLYKSMQASINSRFKSPNKSPFRQTDDLAPVKLEDPKMKPILVKRSRTKKSSPCFCRAVTMVALGLCTVGFLAIMTGLIYMEVFTTKNLTSHETSNDHAEYKLDFPEGYDQLPSLESNVEEGRDVVQKTFQKGTGNVATTEDPLKTRNVPKEIDTLLNNEIEQSDTIELSQYLNNAKAKIKFQDSDTVIYEDKSSDSMKFDLGGFKGRSFLNFNDTENDVPDVKNDSEIFEAEKLKSVETFVNTKVGKLEEKSDEDVSQVELKVLNSKSDGINDDSVKTESDESKPAENSQTSIKLNELESSVSAVLNAKTDPESPVKLNDLESLHGSEVGSDFKTNHGFDKETVELREQDVEILPFIQNVGQDDSEVEKDHNVDLMVEVVDNTEEADLDYVIPSRKGDSLPTETSSSKEVNLDSVQSEDKHSAIPEQSRPVFPKKPVDFKGSLAEAMKHLQVLDVNNKILTSRTKIGKTKENTKKRKQSHISRKEEDVSLERMRYLQKLRNMLYEGFQG